MQFQLHTAVLGGLSLDKMAPPLTAVRKYATAALLGALLAGSASAQTIVSFNGFASHGGLTINSSATVTSTTDGSVIRLVNTNTDLAGSFFTNSLVNASGFSTAFDFRLTSPGGISDGIETGADGLTFTLQIAGANKIGGSGQDLGYGGTTFSHSVAVEFDTFYNGTTDYPSQSSSGSNHVAVDLNGSVSSASNAVGVSPRFDNGGLWTAWIDYNGTVLEVRVSNNQVRPTNPTLSYTINIPTSLDASSAYFGFTGGTGSAYSNEDIIDWAYSNTFVSGGISTPLAVPEPATYELLLAGAALLWLGRRRFRLLS